MIASTDNKRIAKNTLVLYFRMILTMAITLYTSRIVLEVLGVVDYGLYNVVAGVVVMFGFLNSAMAASTERFLIFELGKGNSVRLNQIFSLSVILHVLISVIILILSETLGLWFLNSYLNVPPDRMDAANWVFQFSVFTAILTVLSVPYNALIIAHERMNVFAYVSVFEVILKLLIVFMLQFFGYDKLVLYSILIFGVSVVIRMIYGIYCARKFEEARFQFFWDKKLFSEMTGFAGWNLLGVFAGIGYNQGVNILLNIYFGPVINAARGIAFQVMGAINQLVTNFQIAINPPIIKSYAEKNDKNTIRLIFSSAKFSFFLLLMFVIPLIIEVEYVLAIWLKEVPEHTVSFTRLVLVDILICSLSGPLQILAQATGKVRKYQIVVSVILLLNLPVSYLLLKWGYEPEYTFIVSILLSLSALFARLLVLRGLAKFPVREFIKKVLILVILVSFLTLPLPLFIQQSMNNNLLQFSLVSISSVISLLISVWFIGLSKLEKKGMKNYIFSKLTK